MKKIYLLFTFSTIYFFGCTSTTETSSDSTAVEESEKPSKSDSTNLYYALLNPNENKAIFGPKIWRVTDNISVRNMLIKENDMHKKISQDTNIILGERYFEVDTSTIKALISSIPENGYLGVTFGIKEVGGKFTGLSLGLLSMDEKYNIQKNNIIKLNKFELADTSSFKKLKQKLYSKGLTEFATDSHSKNQYVIFKKSDSKLFFLTFGNLLKKKVYIKMIYDNKPGSIGFPNVLFSNVKNLDKNTRFDFLPEDSFLFGNEGGTCCPPY